MFKKLERNHHLDEEMIRILATINQSLPPASDANTKVGDNDIGIEDRRT